jgi:hypothetical protein
MELEPQRIAKNRGTAATAQGRASLSAGVRPEEDPAVRPKSRRQAARANSAILEADSSSAVSSIKKKTRASPPSPAHALESKANNAARRKPATSKRKAVPTKKRPQDDGDYDFVVADVADDLDDMVPDRDGVT